MPSLTAPRAPGFQAGSPGARHLSFSWGVADELIVVGEQASTAGDGGRPPPASAAWEVTWGGMHAPSQRQLAADATPLFCSLHQSESAHDVEQVADWSRQMSGLLAQQAAPEQSSAPLGEAGPATPGQLRQLARAAWDLVSICYVRANQAASGHLAELLADWLEEHSGALEATGGSGGGSGVPAPTLARKLRLLHERLSGAQVPEDDPDYWGGVCGAASVGWLRAAAGLLRMHSSYGKLDDRQDESGLVEAAAQLLEQMPRLRAAGAGKPLPPGSGRPFDDAAQFNRERDRWLAKLARLEASSFWGACGNGATTRGLQGLLRVLQGSREALGGATCHWLELLVAVALHAPRHVYPASGAGVGGLAKQCKRQLLQRQQPASSLEPSIFDRLLVAILEHSTEEVLSLSAELYDSWFMAHVVELLAVGGASDRAVLCTEREALGDVSLQESYRLQHAQDLLSHAATWQLAVPYLATCPGQGRGVLEASLARLAAPGRGGGRRQALKALEACRAYGLTAPARSICQGMGVECWERGRYGEAVAWLRQAGDSASLDHIGRILLRSIAGGESDEAASGTLLSLEDMGALLDDLAAQHGQLLEGQSALSFLARYVELQKLLAQLQELQAPPHQPAAAGEDALPVVAMAAVRHLMELTVPGIAPPRLFLALLDSSVALLEWPSWPLVGAQDTEELTVRLHTYLTAQRVRPLPWGGAKELQEGYAELPPQRLERIQAALAANLGRVYLVS